MQALTTFSPLVMPLLLSVLPEPELFEPTHEDGDEPDDGTRAAAVLDAIDRGRNLIGALAAYWRVDRALVRSPLSRQPWPLAERFSTMLRLMQAIPAPARPSSPAQVTSTFRMLMQLLGPSLSQRDIERLGKAFPAGWTETWQEAAQLNGGVDLGLRDARDFLRSALDQAPRPNPQLELTPERLALGWIARRGVVALIRASLHWHALPTVTLSTHHGVPEEVEPLLGEYHESMTRATELTSRTAVVAEGCAMDHCVGEYWDDCVFTGTRIWHLELDDGETATAEYCVHPDGAEVQLVQLRGPHNDDPTCSMETWAERVCWALGSESLRERRLALADAARAAQDRYADRGPRQTLRPLDLTLRRALAVVLDYCAQQPDWVVAPNTVYRGSLAGFGYGAGPQVLHQLQAGDPLRLVREPDNPHDPRAVRVEWRGRRLGYVPRTDNHPIAHRLDRQHELEAHILAVDPSENPWDPVAITIRAADVSGL